MQRKLTHTVLSVLLPVVVAVALTGCTNESPTQKDTPTQKSWQRAAAEIAFTQLKDETDDGRRNSTRDYVKALLSLEKGGDADRRFAQGKTLLMMTVIRGDKEIVGQLLSLDVYADVNCADDDGNTPLLVASEQSNVEIVKALIESGAQVNRQNKDGMTPLMACAKHGDKTIAELLMSAGASIHVKDKNGDKAGDYAKAGGHDEMISFLANFQSSKGGK